MDQKAFWDRQAEHFQGVMETGDKSRYMHSVIAFLAEMGCLFEDANILDIGCGTGKYAREFLKHDSRVTGIDLSGRMLEFARQNLETVGSNWSLVEGDWMAMDFKDEWIAAFDLVFASMAPAIRDRTGIERMCRASRRSCFIAKFAERRGVMKQTFREALELSPNDRFGEAISGRQIMAEIQILGFDPEIYHQDYSWERQWTVKKATDRIVSEILLSDPLQTEESLRPRVEQAAREMAGPDGMIHDKVAATALWLYWEV